MYTPGAVAYHNGNVAELQTAIQGAVDSANEAFQNSDIPIVIRLVHAEQVAYTGSGDLYTDRTRLNNPSDGFLDSVHALRNTWGADLVTLVTESSSSGGNADLPLSMSDLNSGSFAFTACNVDSIRHLNYTLAHEIGHNLGAGHERDNPVPTPGIFSYSYGYRFNVGPDVYHDIMSYDPGVGLPLFANPAVLYKGVPTGSPIGTATEADLASTFAVTAPIVAGFRSSVVTDTSGPAGSVFETKLNGRQLDVTIRYNDPSGIDGATLGDGDISITIPAAYGGFTLTAALLSSAHGAVSGAAKFATYRVMLPDNDPPLSQLTYNLKPAAISDSAGNASAAGAIGYNLETVAGWDFGTSYDLGSLSSPMTIYDSLRPDSHDDVYQFAVTSPGIVSVHLDGLTADAQLFVARDVNGNGLYDYPQDEVGGSFRGGTTAESLAFSATPGVYYAWVFQDVTTPYALSIRQYSDSIAPTATLDTTDITAPTSQLRFDVVFKDNQELNAAQVRYDALVRMTTPFGWYVLAYPQSIDEDVNAQTRTAHYLLNFGFTFDATLNGIYTIAMENGDVHDAAGNSIVPGNIGTFRVAVGEADAAPPTVQTIVSPDVPVGGLSSYTFNVTYRDNVGIDANSLDGNDIRVTGPGGFNQLAQCIDVSPPDPVSSTRTATYRITPPGGSWDVADRGTFSIVLQSGQVRDGAANAAAAGAIGSFAVTVPLGGDADRNGAVDISDLSALATHWQRYGIGWGGGDFDYDGDVDISDLSILATHWQQSVPPPPLATPARRAPARAPVGGDVLGTRG